MFFKAQASDYFEGPLLQAGQAIERGDVPALQALQRQGVNFNTPGKQGMTLMWLAIARKQPEMVTALVRLGVEPDLQISNMKGMGTALSYTFMTRTDPNNKEGLVLLKAMLDGGLSPNYKTPVGTPLLHRSIAGNIEHVKLVLAYGADINGVDSLGGGALLKALRSVEPGIALYLIGKGIDLNTFTSIGITPAWSLHLSLLRMDPKYPVTQQMQQVKEAMQARGVKFPPDPPEVVRDHMRAQGLRVVVPHGQSK
jgi:ankyrin repeat protein